MQADVVHIIEMASFVEFTDQHRQSTAGILSRKILCDPLLYSQ
jgi:hypothetical protein